MSDLVRGGCGRNADSLAHDSTCFGWCAILCAALCFGALAGCAATAKDDLRKTGIGQ